MPSILKTTAGCVIEQNGRFLIAPELSIDAVFRATDPAGIVSRCTTTPCAAPAPRDLLAPIESQEVWAAGVTYIRSRDARIEESERSGAERLYDMVYEADRPELFFKASPARVRGPFAGVRIRADSTWNVPEPELTLAINCHGDVIGFTVGNDMSSRDIEGRNPLYLPQAKIYRGSCALGPALVLRNEPLPPETRIQCRVGRGEKIVFSGGTSLDRMKRRTDELADWLFRELDFPNGVYLMTGTGIVPSSTFNLETGDRITISIDHVGVLENFVE
jgi:2-dehydro-3-deoxy-D-arabinonate dehydratase